MEEEMKEEVRSSQPTKRWLILHQALVDAVRMGANGCEAVNEFEGRVRKICDIAINSGCTKHGANHSWPVTTFYNHVEKLCHLGLLKEELYSKNLNDRTYIVRLCKNRTALPMEEQRLSKSQIPDDLRRTSPGRLREIRNIVWALQEDVQTLSRLVDIRLVNLEERVFCELRALRALLEMQVARSLFSGPLETYGQVTEKDKVSSS